MPGFHARLSLPLRAVKSLLSSVYPVEPSLKNMPLYSKTFIIVFYHIIATIIVGDPSILFAASAAAVDVKSNHSNLTSQKAETPRFSKQIDRTDALLAGFNAADTTELPLHEPTGEKTRKTYDFTSKLYIKYNILDFTFKRMKYINSILCFRWCEINLKHEST